MDGEIQSPGIEPLSGAVRGQYNYNLDAVTTTPSAAPATGTLRVNNINSSLVNTIWMSNNTSIAPPMDQVFLNGIAIGDTIMLQDKNDPSIWQQYKVTAAAAFFDPNKKFTVTWLAGSPSPLVLGNSIIFGVIPGLITALLPPVITTATVPDSAPGQPYIIYGSGSATVPATPLPITGSPIIPTSPVPPGGGVGSIGDPDGVPTFPPPTPPPIGQVPIGPLVGPAVAAAPVPPSLAGVVQPQYKTGIATVPAANGYFPLFTTTGAYAGFPNQPPTGVPIVFANIWMIPTLSGGVWTAAPPPSTPTTGQIILNGWGPPGPTGNGPGPPTYPNPPGAGLPHVAGAVYGGHEESAERSGGAVFSAPDLGQLYQSQPQAHRRSKRMSARHAAGGSDLP